MGVQTDVGSVSSEEEIIRRFIAEEMLFTDKGLPIGDDDSFVENSIVDSTGILELEFFVERAFGVEVLDEEITPENFDSVNRLAGYIRRKRQSLTAHF